MSLRSSRTSVRLLRLAAVAAAVAVSIFVLIPPAAEAIEEPLTTNVANATSATVNFRGGLQASVSLTQGTTQYGGAGAQLLTTTVPHSNYGATSAMFSPPLAPAVTPVFGVETYAGMCGDINYSGFCSGNGTMTVTFNQPVTNPILDVSGLGGNIFCVEDGEDQTGGNRDTDCDPIQSRGITIPSNANNDLTAGSSMASQLTITTPGVTFGGLSAGNSNLAITPTTLTSANKAGNTRCDTTAPTMDGSNTYSLDVQTTAGCGSVVLQGTFTTVTFALGTHLRRMPSSLGWTSGYNLSPGTGFSLADLFRVSIRVQEDLGDAPASYDGAQAAAHMKGPLKLGSSYTEDAQNVRNPISSPNASAGANLDTDDAINDGVRANAAARATAYTITVPLSGTTQAGAVGGWIDFNRNGVFETGERVTAPFVAGATSVVLTWNVPANAVLGDTYMRLRTAFTAAEVTNPTGVARSGEVEDYILRIESAAPSIEVIKKINGQDANTAPGVSVLPGSSMTFTFDVTNTGNVPLTGVTLSDNVIPGASLVPPAAWDGTLDPGETVQFTATRTAPTTSGTLHTNIATVRGTPPTGVTPSPVTDTDPANATVAVVHPSIALDKRIVTVTDSNGNGRTDEGDTILWDFVVTNTGDIALTGVVVNDPKLAALGIGVTCNPTTLAAGVSVTCTANAPYIITLADGINGTVVNTATSTGNAPAGPVTSPPDTTTTPVKPSVPLQIEKIGESGSSTWVRMDGSSFAILADVNGVPGTALPFTVNDVEMGLFQVDGIPIGTYWLSELTSPDGFSLLADPVKFVINANRTVTILADGGEAVTASGQLITVRDVPAMELPVAGGSGALPYTLGGTLTVLVAGGLAYMIRRRNSRAGGNDPQS